MSFKVGDKVWTFDLNHRVYPKDENGRTTGGPIYSEHFRQVEITGETTKSWLIGKWQERTPKARPGIFTDEQKADMIWSNQHRHPIVDLVRRCSVEQLKQIAEIVGYKPE